MIGMIPYAAGHSADGLQQLSSHKKKVMSFVIWLEVSLFQEQIYPYIYISQKWFQSLH